MAEKKAVARETWKEYRRAAKKGKALILDQLIRLTGYNRKYAIRVLNKAEAVQATLVANGRTVKLKAEKKAQPKNRLGKPVYTRETAAVLEAIWDFHCQKCVRQLRCRRTWRSTSGKISTFYKRAAS